MGKIFIKINPGRLENPDLDLRYAVPEAIEEATGGAVKGDGYDYLDDENSSMVILLKAEDPESAARDVIALISERTFLDNDLSGAAEILIEKNGEEERVYPGE